MGWKENISRAIGFGANAGGRVVRTAVSPAVKLGRALHEDNERWASNAHLHEMFTMAMSSKLSAGRYVEEIRESLGDNLGSYLDYAAKRYLKDPEKVRNRFGLR